MEGGSNWLHKIANFSELESLDKAISKQKKHTLIGVLDFVLFDS